MHRVPPVLPTNADMTPMQRFYWHSPIYCSNFLLNEAAFSYSSNRPKQQARVPDKYCRILFPDTIKSTGLLPSQFARLSHIGHCMPGRKFYLFRYQLYDSHNRKTAHAAETEKAMPSTPALFEILQLTESWNHNHSTSADYFRSTLVELHIGEEAYGVAAGSGLIRLTFWAATEHKLKERTRELERLVLHLTGPNSSL